MNPFVVTSFDRPSMLKSFHRIFGRAGSLRQTDRMERYFGIFSSHSPVAGQNAIDWMVFS